MSGVVRASGESPEALLWREFSARLSTEGYGPGYGGLFSQQHRRELEDAESDLDFFPQAGSPMRAAIIGFGRSKGSPLLALPFLKSADDRDHNRDIGTHDSVLKESAEYSSINNVAPKINRQGEFVLRAFAVDHGGFYSVFSGGKGSKFLQESPYQSAISKMSAAIPEAEFCFKIDRQRFLISNEGRSKVIAHHSMDINKFMW